MVLSAKQAAARFSLQVVDGSLAGVVFLVPLLMGGRHCLGQLGLTVLAVAAGIGWAAYCLLGSPAASDGRGEASTAKGSLFWMPLREWFPPVLVLLLGVALLLVQVAPLPTWLLQRLAPHVVEILPLWRGTADGAWPGPWRCISLAPAETLASLVVFLDYGLLFVVTLQRVRRVEDVQRLLRWCALSATAMAAFGIVQLLAGNGRFFWFYEHPLASASDVAKGSFTNRNHFAQFLALGIGPLVWWLLDALRNRDRHASSPRTNLFSRSRQTWNAASTDNGLTPYWLALALGVVVFAGLLSLSRGGIAAMVLATAVSITVCWRTAASGVRLLAVLGGTAAVIVASLSIFGLDRVSNRLEDFSAGSISRLDQSAGRRTIWEATLKGIPDFLPFGAGTGSFGNVYAIYSNAYADDDRDVTHAENGYLQVALETGLVGSVLLAAGIGLCVWWCVSGFRRGTSSKLTLCTGAIAASFAASLTHSLVDFVWYAPACTAIVAMLAACALRVRQLAIRDGERTSAARPAMKPTGSAFGRVLVGRGRGPAFAMSAVSLLLLTAVGAWMIGNRIGPALAQPSFDQFMVEYLAAKTQTPDVVGDDPLDEKTLTNWISCLQDVVRDDPSHLAAHLRLAELHQRLFEKLQTTSVNQIPLRHVADAAIQQHFPTRDALATWLSAAVGPHWKQLDWALYHSRQAVALCPLVGRAYVVLGDLSFLCGDRGEQKKACIEQALRVRPLDGVVLMAASQQASIAGDHQLAMEYARRAFASGRHGRCQLLAALVACTPSEELPSLINSILTEFQPDVESVRFLHQACAARCTAEQLAPLALYRAQVVEAEAGKPDNADAAKEWLEAHQLYDGLDRNADALRCARNALSRDSNNYEVRRQLGLCLKKQGLFEEAESHLRWCLTRMPGNQSVAGPLRECLKERLDAEAKAGDQKGRLQ
ncbi:MAG: O-antigen ligase family protein [Planctomycetaceae bacterium]|nr:O-antigen ligase family protein [Planctomycetaceae bacterium]